MFTIFVLIFSTFYDNNLNHKIIFYEKSLATYNMSYSVGRFGAIV